MGKNLGERLETSLQAAGWDLRRVTNLTAALKKPAYLVGGCVRDLLLERRLTDFDIVVEGDAIQLAHTLAKADGGRIIAHPRFGTATWFLADFALDLTTARSESYEHPGALPTVKFSTIQDDLRRRDFTINAMAIRLDGAHFGDFLDPLHGEDDLAHKVIRVLHPRSFLDDPTRMLRAVRYAERYDFEIALETLSLIDDEPRAVFSQLSGERLRHEFDVIFEEKRPSTILARLAELDLLRSIHAALASIDHLLPSLSEPASEWGDFKTADILSVRQMLGWCCWLAPLSPDKIDAIAARLAFPAALAKTARAASSLFSEFPSFAGAKPSQWTFYLDDLPALAVYVVYLRAQEPALKEYRAHWRHIHPHTTGADLKARGLPPGPEYQRILSRLRAAWLDGEVATQEQEVALLSKLLIGEES